jgi:crossover junction endodeoxyribonuclease RuvC
MTRILGIDPGLTKTGWGVIDSEGNRLSFVAAGLIRTTLTLTLAERLKEIDDGLAQVLDVFKPDSAAVEETFMNNNAASALKLGQARGVALLAPARRGIAVGEYPANLIKKSIVGSGHAQKGQMGMMIRVLLPTAKDIGEDEADALAVAITHAHHAAFRKAVGT